MSYLASAASRSHYSETVERADVCGSGRSWCLWCLFGPEIGSIHAKGVERVAKGETVEIGSIHAVFTHVDENMVGCSKRLGEYPTVIRTSG